MALVLSMAIIFGYQKVILEPKQKAFEEQQAALAAEQADGAKPADSDSMFEPIAQEQTPAQSRAEALAETPARLRVDTPELLGSINLTGLTFDDITLKNFRTSIKDDAPMVTILSPKTTADAQFARSGVAINGRADEGVVWSAPENAVLTPSTPVTLTRTEGDIEHRVTLSVDDKFMFTVVHTVANSGDSDVTILPYGGTYQRGIPSDLKNFRILFEGPLAIVGEELQARKYKTILNKGGLEESGIGGWVGITDKNWLTAAIPPQDQHFRVKIDATREAQPIFRAQYSLDPISIPAGTETSVTSHIFAGAKLVQLLRAYQKPVEKGGLGVSRFDMAVDWGHFFILTRPIFNTLHFFANITGNYGIAILLLTLCLKAILFPLANLSYKSMAGMRIAQPEMQKIRERYKDDQMKQQQEMAALFKKHGINPAAGCLPVIAQMPIFFALYKTLFVTTEMRHQGFLYIKDLSERDPTSVFNLFGLLPFDPSTVPVIGGFLSIGVLPLIMGAAMWVQMRLNPPPTDPMQARIFGLMPLFFMFIFAPFAAGLVLYWAWNTTLSVIQQYIIMKRNGADVDLVGNIKGALPFLSKGAAATNDNKTK